jgi:Flp pilus assembly protein TadD
MARFRAASIAACLALLAAGCASDGGTFATPSGVAPETMVAQIRAAAGQDDTELAVQPLRDPMVEDLRGQALSLEQQRRYADAVAALEQALVLVPDDPALLQERAEAAVLVGDFATATRLAKRAWDLGAKVGPLCRRHWATVEQARLLAGDAAGAATAKAQVAQCTVAGVQRY